MLKSAHVAIACLVVWPVVTWGILASANAAPFAVGLDDPRLTAIRGFGYPDDDSPCYMLDDESCDESPNQFCNNVVCAVDDDPADEAQNGGNPIPICLTSATNYDKDLDYELAQPWGPPLDECETGQEDYESFTHYCWWAQYCTFSAWYDDDLYPISLNDCVQKVMGGAYYCGLDTTQPDYPVTAQSLTGNDCPACE